MSCTRGSGGAARRGQRAAAGGWGRGGPLGLWAHAQVRLVHALLWGYRPVYFDPPTIPESGTGLGSPREQNPGLVCRTENRRIRLYPPTLHAFKVSGALQAFSDLCLKGVILASFSRSTKAAVTSQSVPWDSPGKNTGVGCHFLLQGIFLTQESNPGLLHCRQMLYHLSHQGSPQEWKPHISGQKNIFASLQLTPLQYSCLENPMDRGAW